MRGAHPITCVAALLLLLGAAALHAATSIPVDDSYSVRTWQVEDGLPDNRIVGVVQAPDGFLWVATQGALVRFDGVRFQRVDQAGAPDLIAGTMRLLTLDPSGQVWLAKEEGGTIFRFTVPGMHVMLARDGLLRAESQRSLAVDSAGALWVSYTGGRVIRVRNESETKLFSAEDGLPAGGETCWLATDRNGKVWFAKAGKVGLFRDGRFQVLHDFGTSALKIASAHGDGIWVCAGQRVAQLREKGIVTEKGRLTVPSGRDRTGFEPSALFEGREGVLWIGTAAAGLFRCETNSIVQVELPNSSILSLAEDHEGNLWVGTRGGGLNRVKRRMTFMIHSETGLPLGSVQSVTVDTAGRTWAVGDNGMLARGRGSEWTVEQVQVGNGRRAYVTCVAAETNGTVWVGARGGNLYQWSAGTYENCDLNQRLRNSSLRSLLVGNKSELWIATDASDALYRYAEGRLQTFSLPPGRRFIRAMALEANGDFWAGATDGLLIRIRGDQLQNETGPGTPLSVRCLYAPEDGGLWIGYAGGGAARLKDGTYSRFTSEHGMPNDYVSQILMDDRKQLWFAGNQGLFKVREKDFDEIAQGIAARVRPVLYGRNEGLPSLQASFDYCPTSVRTADNRLLFSTLSGLAEVRLDHARLNYRAPRVYIERVTSDGRLLGAYLSGSLLAATNAQAPVELTHGEAKPPEVRFPPGARQVQFEFTALSFVAPENVQFRYKLEGLDDDWIEAGHTRIASYTHPPPGRYKFLVTACNNDGIWNVEGDTLFVRFEPFYWQTLWFRIPAGLLGATVLGGGVVIVLRRRHARQLERLEHQRALEIERTRIARDLHDDLGVGLTEIGLLGDLTSARDDLPSQGKENLAEITGRARSLAASLDEIVWAINPANDTCQGLVDYCFPYAQKLLGRANIRCRLELVEPIPGFALNAEKRHGFFHAFKEALNNIIRHSGATEVRIGFESNGDHLIIRVADNGRGFAPTTPDGSHHGLSGMRERLLRMGGWFEVISSPGAGTKLTFGLPTHSGAKK